MALSNKALAPRPPASRLKVAGIERLKVANFLKDEVSSALIIFTDSYDAAKAALDASLHEGFKRAALGKSMGKSKAASKSKQADDKDAAFSGKIGQVVSLHTAYGNSVTVIGTRVEDDKVADDVNFEAYRERSWLDQGGRATRIAASNKVSELVIEAALEDKRALPYLLEGLGLRRYSYDRFFTSKEAGHSLRGLRLVSDSGRLDKASLKLVDELSAVWSAVDFARDLCAEPPNYLYPESYAAILKRAFTPLGISVTILDEKKLQALGCGALLAVGKGSERKPVIVAMQWRGRDKKDKKNKGIDLALVGKGVTFDTGGISLKPSMKMQDMKFDMGGSAAVCGAMMALALRKAKANVTGIVGLAENMPSHRAYRPGDILLSASGKTIEVQNTDAEGRLVLADLLWYAQHKVKASRVINLATLTGAMLISLGAVRAGLFSNDRGLVDDIVAASMSTGEEVWHLPMGSRYDSLIKSNYADMSNIGPPMSAGSILAAQFLARFIDKGTAWAHLDIAGTAWSGADTGTSPVGATGWGVRLLNRLVADNYG